MLIQIDSTTQHRLVLGIQTKCSLFKQEMHNKIRDFMPKDAKSYTILWLKYTDRNGNLCCYKTGYGSFEVVYFTNTKWGCFDRRSNKIKK